MKNNFDLKQLRKQIEDKGTILLQYRINPENMVVFLQKDDIMSVIKYHFKGNGKNWVYTVKYAGVSLIEALSKFQTEFVIDKTYQSDNCNNCMYKRSYTENVEEKGRWFQD